MLHIKIQMSSIYNPQIDGNDVGVTINPLHVLEGPIIRSKTKKIKEAFTLYV